MLFILVVQGHVKALAVEVRRACDVLSAYLCQKDLLEKEMATHSSMLAWKILWTEERGRLQSMGSQRVRQDWATSLHFKLWQVHRTIREETALPETVFGANREDGDKGRIGESGNDGWDPSLCLGSSLCWTGRSLRPHMVLTFYPGFITMDTKHKAVLVRIWRNWNFSLLPGWNVNWYRNSGK